MPNRPRHPFTGQPYSPKEPPHRFQQFAGRFIDGRRGLFLTLAGIMFLPVSISYITRTQPLSQFDGYQFLPDWVSLSQFGIVFAICGLIATIIGLLSKRLSSKVVGYGFAAATLPPTIAVCLGVASILLGGNVIQLVNVVTYATLSMIIYVVSVWPNPTPPLPDPPDTGPVETEEED